MARAIISVSDKAGIVDFAKELQNFGYEIVSTGGTARALVEHGINVKPINEVTKFPEMLEGRVKTLHPAIHAGILAKRTEEHLNQLKEQGIEPIDLVVVNLYPFEKKLLEGAALEEMIENIDIGGPTLIRAAAKNYEFVSVLTSPGQYQEFLKELKNGKISKETREKLATEAFNHVARYDVLIDNYFQKTFTKETFPENLNLTYKKLQDLRYGDNPDQKSAFYRDFKIGAGVVSAEQLHGKQLSYNNILDLNSAWELAHEFEEPTVVIIKHNNPCGVATGKNLAEAYDRALETDPISAYGSVVGVNRPLDKETAEKIVNMFVEAVIAREYEPGTIEILKKKKNLRIMHVRGEGKNEGLELRGFPGGVLAQTPQTLNLKKEDLKIVSEREPTEQEIKDMIFGFKVVKYVVSNSILFAKNQQTVGLCGGQTSRVDAVKFSAQKARIETKGAVMASDAFFPFRDGVDEAAKAGITAVIQPGGSIRDQEAIDAVNEHGMAMVFTGKRVFRH